MAIYHLNAKIISRGKGQSAIAAAAYRSGEKLRDEQAAEQKFYAARADRILFIDIMAPGDAPEWVHDRNRLWNEAERAEKRKDAQLAREIEVSLPHELSAQQREWLVKDFAREAFVRRGYVVDIAIHAPENDADARNHHAHLMVTRRTIGPDGFARTKDWQFDPKQLASWREQWADLANRHLARHGHAARIDHRSLEEQGVEREPTIHLGYAAQEIAERGGQSERMNTLRDVVARNGERSELHKDLAAINAELKALQPARPRSGQERAHGHERRTNASGGKPRGLRSASTGQRVRDYVALCRQPQKDLRRWLAEDKKRPSSPTTSRKLDHGSSATPDIRQFRHDALPQLHGGMDTHQQRRRHGDHLPARSREGLARHVVLRSLREPDRRIAPQPPPTRHGNATPSIAARLNALPRPARHSDDDNRGRQTSGQPVRQGRADPPASLPRPIHEERETESFEVEARSIRAMYGAHIEILRRQLQGDARASAIASLKRQMKDAIAQLTARRKERRAVRRANRQSRREEQSPLNP